MEESSENLDDQSAQPLTEAGAGEKSVPGEGLAAAETGSEEALDFIRPPRYEADINLVIEKDGDYEYARMQDFSVRGFMCVLYNKYEDHTRLQFALEGPKTEFRCLGELVWVKRKTWFPRRTWLAGVRIIGNKLPTEFMTEIAGVRVNDDEDAGSDYAPGLPVPGKGERRSGGDRRFRKDRRSR